MHNGVRVVAGGYYGAWMTEIIERLKGHHEPQEELVFHHLIERLVADPPDAPVVVELGAFWSYYALWFLHRIPNGRAVLVEPDPGYLAIGRRNFALNGFDGRGLFVPSAIGSAPTAPQPFACESDGVVRPVPVESIPSVLAAASLDHIDLLLVDVQGAELSALTGARTQLTEGAIRFVVVSTHHHLISGDPLMHQRCTEFLQQAGGHIVAEHTVAESFSGDGLVVAAFDERDKDLVVDVSRARASDSHFGDPLVDLAAAQDLTRHLHAQHAATTAGLATARAELASAEAERDATRRQLEALLDARAVRVAMAAQRLLSAVRARPGRSRTARHHGRKLL